ncbi:MAG: hypothetical protein JO356_09700, partial [Acidobacteria bacterium]|nr:hypothetical protein [Acidobacteriota bacterium]
MSVGHALEDFSVCCGDADIQIAVVWADDLEPPQAVPWFDSGGVWSLFQEQKEFVFSFSSAALGLGPYKRLRAADTFHSAELTLNRALLGKHLPVRPLEYPADELLITNHLAFQGVGAEVHGCGLMDEEIGGQLFLGHSGAGKSTTTRLWNRSRKVTVLSDDRVILRLEGGDVWMHGT